MTDTAGPIYLDQPYQHLLHLGHPSNKHQGVQEVPNHWLPGGPARFCKCLPAGLEGAVRGQELSRVGRGAVAWAGHGAKGRAPQAGPRPLPGLCCLPPNPAQAP